MKKALKIIGIISILAIWVFLSALADYRWADNVIQEKTGEGWVVVDKQANLVDISSPWTLVKRPISRLAFVSPNQSLRFKNEIILTPLLWVHYDDFKKTRDEEMKYFVDCSNEKTAVLKEGFFPRMDLETIEWHEEKYEMGTEVIKQVCEGVVMERKNNDANE